jgi:hypothetical protein
MRNFQIKPSGEAVVPWHEDTTLEDFDGDEEAFFEYLDEQADAYEEIGAKLRPGEPHPMNYQWCEEDDTYRSDLKIFENVVALDRHAAKNQPELPPDQYALFYGTGKDKKEAQDRLEMRKFIDEQLQKAAQHRARGNPVAARDCEQRAAQYSRGIEKMERNYSYSFEAEDDRNVVEYGDRELSSMVHWDSDRVKQNADRIRGMIEGWRQMSDREYSFTLTNEGGDYRVSKVKHPNLPANEISARVGNHSEETLLRKLGMGGVETREEPEPVTEAPAEAPEPEPEKQSNPMDIEIAPGMFGGIK